MKTHGVSVFNEWHAQEGLRVEICVMRGSVDGLMFSIRICNKNTSVGSPLLSATTETL